MLHLARGLVAISFGLASVSAAAQVTAPTSAQLAEARGRPAQSFSIQWSDASVRGTEVLARCLKMREAVDMDDWDDIDIGVIDNHCSFGIRMKFAPGTLNNGTCVREPDVPVQEINADAGGAITFDRTAPFTCLFEASVVGIAPATAAAKPQPSPAEIAQKTLSDMAATGTIEIRNQERHNDAETWYLWRQASAAKATNACYTAYAANQVNKRSDNVTTIATNYDLDWAQIDHVELNGRFVLIIGKWMKEGEFAAFYHASEADAKRGHYAMAALRDAC